MNFKYKKWARTPRRTSPIIPPAVPNNFSASPFNAIMDTSSLALVVLIILGFTYALLSTLKYETADEGFHSPIIFEFLAGRFGVSPDVAVLPVYHAIIAGAMYVLDYASVKFARFISLLISLLAVPVFYQICVSLKRKDSDVRTLMFLLFPIILPFFSLLYTDLPALLFVLCTVLFSLRRQYWVAAIFAGVAVFMRQTNLVWVGFCGLLIILEHWFEAQGGVLERSKTLVPVLFPKLAPYGIVVAVFGAFVYWNGGVAVGTAQLQQVSFNPSNLYFYLMLMFFFFLPYNIQYAKKVYFLLASNYALWVLLIVIFGVYFKTYSNSHQFNSFGLSFYLRNIVLHYTVTLVPLRALVFIPMVWMALTFYLMAKDSEKPWHLYLLYFVSALCIAPLPLVEQRYYMPLIALFIAWKPYTNVFADRCCLFMYVPLSATALYFISQHALFL